MSLLLFFFNDTATTEIYTLSLHDALPISRSRSRAPTTVSYTDGLLPRPRSLSIPARAWAAANRNTRAATYLRSEEHTSELQSPDHLVCRLLLEKKKNKKR